MDSGAKGNREHGQRGEWLGCSLEPSSLAGPTRVTLGKSVPFCISVFPSVK